MAAHDWYAIGASFRGNRMGVRRPDATMTPLDVAVMKHAFSQPGVATGGINFYRANFFRSVFCVACCLVLVCQCVSDDDSPLYAASHPTRQAHAPRRPGRAPHAAADARAGHLGGRGRGHGRGAAGGD